MTAQFDAVAEAQNGFKLLLKNWILAVPTAIVSLIQTILFVVTVGAALAAIMAGTYGSTGLGAMAGAFSGVTGLLFLVVALLMLVAHAAVMSAARDAWNGKAPDIAAGLAHGLSRIVDLLIAGILLFLMFVVTIIIPVLGALVVGFLMMYVLPAIILGGQGAIAAISSSYRLVTTNFSQTIVGFLAILVVVIVGNLISRMFLFVPGVNFVVSLIVGGLAYAYAAIILGRFYTLLTEGAPAGTLAAPMPPPMPPSMPPPMTPPSAS